MGLSASQARILLLTAKNDAYELQAQKIEQERLMLAQEQEEIANEYSEATTNQIKIAKIINDGGTTTESLSLKTLSQSLAGATNSDIVITDSNGTPIVKATAQYNTSTGTYDMAYTDANGSKLQPNNKLVTFLNNGGVDSPLSKGLENGTYRLYVKNEVGGEENGTDVQKDFGAIGSGYVQKSTESLDGVTSRYYTEDDAAAQAKYNSAMTRVNNLDKRLENKLNQIETQKKAVEQEMESVKSIIQSNEERTFQYFS